MTTLEIVLLVVSVIQAALLFASVLFAQGGKKNKNNNDFSNQQPVGAIVMPAPTANSPAKEKKDFNKELLKIVAARSRDSIQFYLGAKARIIRGIDTIDVFQTRINKVGDITVVNKVIQVDEKTPGTFWKIDKDGTLWITFDLEEKGFLPGDSISLPFRPNGGDNTAYTLKGTGDCSVQVEDSKILPCQRFIFGAEDFIIYSGMGSAPLQVVIENRKEPVIVKGRRVNNGGNVTPAAAQQPQQQFDVFKVPTIE